MSKKPSLFFIVGCPRSGTTLLRRLLDAHPQAAVAPETFFLHTFWNHRDRYPDLCDSDTFDRLLDDLFAHPEIQKMNLSRDALRGALPPEERSWPAIFRALLSCFADAQNATHVGEKTPLHVLYADTLRQWFPEAPLVHLVRDPRAVVNSWRRVPWSSGYRWRDAEVWTQYVRAGRRAEAKHPSHVLSLTFEALVRTPAPTLQKVCAFLGVSYHEQMLAFHKTEPSTGAPSLAPWKQRALAPIDATVADRWRNELSTSAQAQVEAIACGEMQYWGYPCETSPLQRHPARLRAALERPVWKLRTLVRSD
jgi:hypothetical protein